jgi:glycylpeptide N-tetradecanoyltransferase
MIIINKILILKKVYTLLTENYVEDDDCMFRYSYIIKNV